MRILGRLGGWLLLRRTVRALDRLATAQEQQTRLLARIADRLAPADPQTDPQIVAVETGASYLDQGEAAVALAYAERTRRDTGREPTDDEILLYLADEKTQDLHRRLVERDAALAALAKDRG